MDDAVLSCDLFHAALQGNVEQVNFLLDRCANINAVDVTSFRRTALHYAVIKGAYQVASSLIENGALLDAATTDNTTALHYAAAHFKRDIARLLLDRGASVDSLTNNDDTPLHWAAYYGARQIAMLLIDHGANIEIRNVCACSSMHKRRGVVH
jgi:ankyrin repeat protein